MSNLNLFSKFKALVISLEYASERRENASEQLNKTNINWSFMDAIIGKNFQSFPDIYDRKKRLRHVGFDMSMGEIACFLSHRKAWEQCLSENKTLLIFEDDFELLDNFEDALQVAFSIEDSWDIFRLHSLKFHLISNTVKYGDFEVFKHLKDPSGSAAYLITPQAAQTLLNLSKKIYLPVDDFLERIWEHKLRILAIRPMPVKIAFEESTITDRRKPYMSLAKKISRELYRIPDGIIKFYYRTFKSKL